LSEIKDLVPVSKILTHSFLYGREKFEDPDFEILSLESISQDIQFIHCEFLLSSYMEYIESIGFTPKILNLFFAQIMFFTDKKS
jgi:hypothetical protein